MTLDWEVTADGSLSCRDNETGQLCHNSAGAVLEARENYVTPASLDDLRDAGVRHLRLLDACYGLGYNSWALLDHVLADAKNRNKPPVFDRISIVAVERSAEMLQNSPLIYAGASLDVLKEKLGPLEHNTYYRTLKTVLEKGFKRFKVRMVPVLQEHFVSREEAGRDNRLSDIWTYRVEFTVLDSQGKWIAFKRIDDPNDTVEKALADFSN